MLGCFLALLILFPVVVLVATAVVVIHSRWWLALGEVGEALDGNLVAFAVVLVVLVVHGIFDAGGWGFQPFSHC